METQAADQVITISLRGMEYALVLSGKAAVRIAALLLAMAKWAGQHEKSRGAMRLGSMLRSGKELTVFSVPEQSMRDFTREARRYGITYCALRDKRVKDGVIDLLVRSEDAPKINRIVERYNMLPVDARVAAKGHSDPGREPLEKNRRETLPRGGPRRTSVRIRPKIRRGRAGPASGKRVGHSLASPVRLLTASPLLSTRCRPGPPWYGSCTASPGRPVIRPSPWTSAGTLPPRRAGEHRVP